MKQTAMQLAIKHYEKLSEQGSNQAYVVAKFLKDNFLEMEKQQIMNAWYNGFEENRPYVDHSEDYYIETYKQD